MSKRLRWGVALLISGLIAMGCASGPDDDDDDDDGDDDGLRRTEQVIVR